MVAREKKKAARGAPNPQYKDEKGGRLVRMYNICIAYFALKAIHKEMHGIGTSAIREHIRTATKMPTLTGEAHLGDLRAHGDAVGGHGLKLKMIKRGKRRAVLFCDENDAACHSFMEGGDSDIVW